MPAFHLVEKALTRVALAIHADSPRVTEVRDGRTQDLPLLAGGSPVHRNRPVGPTAAKSAHTSAKVARTETADRVVQSVCPYCAVGCGQRVFVKDDKVVQIENPDSPISRGRLCPKGSASEQLVNSPGRQTAMLYRRPFGTHWEPLDLETATNMVADRVIASRANTWQDVDQNGKRARQD